MAFSLKRLRIDIECDHKTDRHFGEAQDLACGSKACAPGGGVGFTGVCQMVGFDVDGAHRVAGELGLAVKTAESDNGVELGLAAAIAFEDQAWLVLVDTEMR